MLGLNGFNLNLLNAKFSVSLENSFSEILGILCCVPHGSVLGLYYS